MAALLLGFAFWAGTAAGARSGNTARSACTAGLAAGSPAVVAGVLLDRLPGSAGPLDRRLARVRIGSATLVGAGRRCRLPEVRVFVRLGAEDVRAGAVVLLGGTWRPADAGRLPRPPDAQGWVGSARIERVDANAAGGLEGAVARWRGALSGQLAARLGPSSGPVGAALLLADRTTLDREARQAFVDAGIVHLLAISGLHVGLIGAGIAWLVGLRIPGPARLLPAAALTGVYVLLIGAPPSAVRASLVFAGYALAARRGRPARVEDLGGLAAVLALLGDPLVVTDPGFQLSFAGFAGVIAGGRIGLPAFVRTSPARGPARATVVSACAFLATAPLATLHFERLVPASIPASVVATGLVALALPALALALVLPAPPGLWLAAAADLLLRALRAVADVFAALPLRWTGPELAPTTWLTLLAVGVLAWDRRGRRTGTGVLALAAALVVTWIGPALAFRRGLGVALVCTLDVGQGDAAVARTGSGRWLVFDAGPGTGFLGSARSDGPPLDLRFGDAGRRVLVPFLEMRGARAVELLAISHPHLDHFGGSAPLLERLRVRRVLDPAVPEPSGAYLAFLDRIEEEGALWVAGAAGDRLRIDDVTLEVLWPPSGSELGANEGSLAFRLEADGFRYLNTGDAPAGVEARILETVAPGRLRADVLKLGHHGSRTSSSRAWLETVRPAIAVVSAGAGNRYGHPHAQTLARLDSAAVERVWRTDRDGPLCIRVADGAWTVAPP